MRSSSRTRSLQATRLRGGRLCWHMRAAPSCGARLLLLYMQVVFARLFTSVIAVVASLCRRAKGPRLSVMQIRPGCMQSQHVTAVNNKE